MSTRRPPPAAAERLSDAAADRVWLSGTGFVARAIFAALARQPDFTVPGVLTGGRPRSKNAFPEALLANSVDEFADRAVHRLSVLATFCRLAARHPLRARVQRRPAAGRASLVMEGLRDTVFRAFADKCSSCRSERMLLEELRWAGAESSSPCAVAQRRRCTVINQRASSGRNLPGNRRPPPRIRRIWSSE